MSGEFVDIGNTNMIGNMMTSKNICAVIIAMVIFSMLSMVALAEEDRNKAITLGGLNFSAAIMMLWYDQSVPRNITLDENKTVRIERYENTTVRLGLSTSYDIFDTVLKSDRFQANGPTFVVDTTTLTGSSLQNFGVGWNFGFGKRSERRFNIALVRFYEKVQKLPASIRENELLPASEPKLRTVIRDVSATGLIFSGTL